MASHLIMTDLIRASVERKQIIFHEEIARDGAQGKSFLSGADRAATARAHAALFGETAVDRLVFMAGFPSSSPEEFAAVREIATEVDTCYLGVAGRCSRSDVDTMFASLKGVSHGRIVIILPISKATCKALVHDTPAACLKAAIDVVRYALDRSPPGIVVDFAMLDASRAEPGFLTEVIATLMREGASMGIVCDTVGALLPSATHDLFVDLKRQLPQGAPLVCHLHNDLGFGQTNTLEALRAGVLGLTSSWLGLGERAGMPCTEQLLFNLAHHFELLKSDFGLPQDIQMAAVNLKGVVPLARKLSLVMNFPLRTTDPIIGLGVNTISTGTPFSDPKSFQPYDPEAVLGVSRRTLLTALANQNVVTFVANELGFTLNAAHAEAALRWVKAEIYRRKLAVLPRDEFQAFLEVYAPEAFKEREAVSAELCAPLNARAVVGTSIENTNTRFVGAESTELEA